MSDQAIQGYCVRCKAQRELVEPQPVFLGEQGRPATQGVCPVCGTKVTRFGRTPAHEGLAPPAPSGSAAPKPSAPRARPPRPGRAETAPAAPAGGHKMVIVESPAKARTVGRFLGRGFAVESSVGHIRDLPANRMGVDLEHDFQPHYVIPEKKKEVVKRLQAAAKNASEVYLATDPDREGEAIAWHLAAALERQLRGLALQRVEFHEITQEAIEHAFAHPRQIDQLRVDSQQARRILDRVVGYTLSPLLRDKIGRKGLSAGRVQSVALRLICEREREIQAFVPVEYWSIEAELRKLLAKAGEEGLAPSAAGDAEETKPAHSFIARLVRVRGQEPILNNQAEAQAIIDDLEGAEYRVDKVTRREVRRNPLPPFMTSTLQQDASRRLGLAPRQTMGLAQALYEGKEIGSGERVGLITYMRTDSVQVAASAQAEARDLILERFGQRYLPATPPQFKTRVKAAQEAHEAIRPTSVRRTPEQMKAYLTRDELRLYTLIWQRFVASQMAAAILDQTSVEILAGAPGAEKPYLFRATGSVVKFPGFLRVYEERREEGEAAQEEGEGIRLPPLEKGELLELLRLLPRQHFTQPPPRYTEASLIRALEEYGIGRPSTYAPILTTLQQRGYVDRIEKKLVPTHLGFVTNDLLVEFFPDVVNVAYTAEMEEQLDLIATGGRGWVQTLHELYTPFAQAVEVAREEMPRVEFKPEPTGEPCPQCGQPLVFRQGRRGRFIGCSGWPQCRYTASIPVPGATCPKCGGPVLEKRARTGRRFYGCANYPTCDWAGPRPPAPARDTQAPG